MTLAARLICGVIFTATLSLAAAPVASVSSSSNFSLDGTSMTLTGVMSWPIVVGDEITTAASSGFILFKDGSQLTVAPKSTLRIRGTETSPVVVLEAGVLDYKIAKGSKISLVRQQDGPRVSSTAIAAEPVTQAGARGGSRVPAVATALAGSAGGLGVLFASGRLSSGVGALTTSSAVTSPDFTARKISISVYK